MRGFDEVLGPSGAGRILAQVRAKGPLVHFITNYVTVNDCANITIAAGGSPVMADDPMEAAEIQALACALVINIGTLNGRTIEGMVVAGRAANALGHPVILDPCGAGASEFRNRTVRRLLEEVRFALIRGNASEISWMACGEGSTQGVDVASDERLCSGNVSAVSSAARALSQQTGAVVSVSGEVDLVVNGFDVVTCTGGDAMMGTVSGTGCMASAVAGVMLGGYPASPFKAAVAASAVMKNAGEAARVRLNEMGGGNASYRTYLIDAVYLTEARIG